MDRMGFLSASRYTYGANKIVQKVKLYIWVTSSLPWPPSWQELQPSLLFPLLCLLLLCRGLLSFFRHLLVNFVWSDQGLSSSANGVSLVLLLLLLLTQQC